MGNFRARRQSVAKGGKEPWNGTDFYASFGEGDHRAWEHARTYGFISGGDGRWYSQKLEALQPGHRVFVHIPGRGYVGVGEVVAPSVPVVDFTVPDDGHERPILEAPLVASKMGEYAGDPDRSEYRVRIRWLATKPVAEAVWEKGMFANQNTACSLRSTFTRKKVLERFGLDQ